MTLSESAQVHNATRPSPRPSWFNEFIGLQGTSVLSQTLLHIARKGIQRYVFIWLGSAHSFTSIKAEG